MFTRLFKDPAFWLTLFFLSATGMILLVLQRDFSAGGHMWKQGDWLINSEMIGARRGLLGSLLIGISDATHLRLLVVTLLLQGALAVATFYLTWRACMLQGVTTKLLVLMVSSGFLLTFWLNDMQGAYRKEIFAFLAMALLAYGASQKVMKPWVVLASLLAFAAGIAVHEGLIFLLPAYAVALYFACGKPANAQQWIVSGIFLIVVMLLFVFNATHPSLASSDPVCAPLLQRGFGQNFCGGAINALTHTLSDEMNRVSSRRSLIASLILAYAVALVPLFYFLYDGSRRNTYVLVAAILSGLVFTPLYIVAEDWGRWLVFHMTSVIYIILVMRARGQVSESRWSYPVPIAVVLCMIPMLLAYEHSSSAPTFGFVAKMIVRVTAG